MSRYTGKIERYDLGDRITALIMQGKSTAEIARILTIKAEGAYEISQSTVSRWIGKDAHLSRKGDRRCKIERYGLEARVFELAEQGKSTAEIARILTIEAKGAYEISQTAVSRWGKATGLFKKRNRGNVAKVIRRVFREYQNDVLKAIEEVNRKHQAALIRAVKKKALQRLQKDASKLRGDDREILLSFVTDPYQPMETELEVTREAIETLIENGLRFTILTKGGTKASRDFDLLGGYDKARFGSTLIFTLQDGANKWESRAPSINDRISPIEPANIKGIKTWISLEPLIDPGQALELIRELHPIVDHWKVGKLNYQVLDVDWIEFRDHVMALLESLGSDYYLKKSLPELF